MINTANKMQIQILYYIRQADESSFSDLCKKLFLNKETLRTSEGKFFLCCIFDLHNANFIKITNKNPNVDVGQIDDTEDGWCVRTLLSSAMRAYSLSDVKRFNDEINPNDVMISMTDYFYTVQRAIGFSITAEMSQLQKQIQRNSILGEVNPTLKSKVFVIMSFSDRLNSIYEDHIVSVCKKLRYSCMRADLIDCPNVIINDIWSGINSAKAVIADCTGKNANVFYEIGIVHALGKRVILITQNSEDIPFDISRIRYIKYENTVEGLKKFDIKLSGFLSGEIRAFSKPHSLAKW